MKVLPVSLDRIVPSASRLCLFAMGVGLIATVAGCPGASPKPSVDQPEDEVAISDLSDLENDDFVPEDGFRLLTVADFDHFPADAESWSEVGKTIICNGSPKGYAYTREPFENFTLRCVFRYVPRGAPPDAEAAEKFNTGFMLYIQEPHKTWPLSLEVQGRMDEIGSVKGNGGASATGVYDDPVGRRESRRPVGQWNEIEIVCNNGAVLSKLNGVNISTCQPSGLTSGPLGLQSEGFEVHFKHLRVRVED